MTPEMLRQVKEKMLNGLLALEDPEFVAEVNAALSRGDERHFEGLVAEHIDFILESLSHS